MNTDEIKNSDKIWVLIHTKANQELIAERNLNEQGFKTFVPLIYPNNRVNNKKTLIPVFPRYIFTQINLNQDNWTSIKSTLGVDKIVMFSEEFPFIPNETINLIKEKLDKSGVYKDSISVEDYQKGEKVSIKQGQFAGVSAIFLSKKSNDRVRLLMNFLSSSVVAEIKSSDLGDKEVIRSFKF